MLLNALKAVVAGVLAGLVLYLLGVFFSRLPGRTPHLPTTAPAAPNQAAQPSPDPTHTDGTVPTSDFVGVVLPSEEATLSVSVDGQVETINAAVDREVSAGTVLASLDIEHRLHAQLAEAKALEQEAQAIVKGAESSHAHHQRTRDRENALYAQGASTPQRVEEVEHQLAASQQQLELAKAKLLQRHASVEKVSEELKGAQVRAPFNGIVSACLVSRGELVKPGRPLFRLIGMAPSRVRFAVPPESAQLLRVGQPIELCAGHPAQLRRGTVATVEPVVDIAAQMIIAEAALDAETSAAVQKGIEVRVGLANQRCPAVRP